MKYILLFTLFLFATTLMAAPVPLPKPYWEKEGSLASVYFVDNKGMQISKEDTDKEPVSLYFYVHRDDAYLSYKCDKNIKIYINDRAATGRDLIWAWEQYKENLSNQEGAAQVEWKVKVKTFKGKYLEVKVTVK